jgi:hypothetical protein
MPRKYTISEPAALEVLKFYERHIEYDSVRDVLSIKALAGASEPHFLGECLGALGGFGHEYDGKGVKGNEGSIIVRGGSSLDIAKKLANANINFKGRANVPAEMGAAV